jgi:hypothetical protein
VDPSRAIVRKVERKRERKTIKRARGIKKEKDDGATETSLSSNEEK